MAKTVSETVRKQSNVPCADFLQFGRCRYGAACLFQHGDQKVDVLRLVRSLNKYIVRDRLGTGKDVRKKAAEQRTVLMPEEYMEALSAKVDGLWDNFQQLAQGKIAASDKDVAVECAMTAEMQAVKAEVKVPYAMCSKTQKCRKRKKHIQPALNETAATACKAETHSSNAEVDGAVLKAGDLVEMLVDDQRYRGMAAKVLRQAQNGRWVVEPAMQNSTPITVRESKLALLDDEAVEDFRAWARDTGW
eukprot:NODE_2125_length_1132_cov_134.583085_g2108_i0.p1 GENE.NODE_2125_length_1132_cov_134.583085_g2108_i0~~NODE_2125_length_1132_cov_134.583085_g2108_i0.p1  ORF type:complete len:247 (+),score=47.72 NODE_2125_length_1132_cov_134.583085_g2108_i0:122-862(+)